MVDNILLSTREQICNKTYIRLTPYNILNSSQFAPSYQCCRSLSLLLWDLKDCQIEFNYSKHLSFLKPMQIQSQTKIIPGIEAGMEND